MATATIASTDEVKDRRREAREICHDLFEHRAAIYWADLLCTLTVGYGAAATYVLSPNFSWQQLLCLPVAGFALFRAANFMHEVAHFHRGEMTAFKVAWNLLCGIPFLTPSFFYETHLEHHRTDSYGTERDGEYIPFASGTRRDIFEFCLQALLLPVYIFFRFLLAPLSFLHPRLRAWVLEHSSSFVINFRHRRHIPADAPRRLWAAIEMLCCARAWALLGPVLLGGYPWYRIVQIYVLAVFTLSLNHWRALVAHRYHSQGQRMTHREQIEYSVTITGHPLLTELFFPVGLRYHTLHHMFPAMPYHSLGQGHRRLMAELPADDLYRKTVYPSVLSVLGKLWQDVLATERARGRAAGAAGQAG